MASFLQKRLFTSSKARKGAELSAGASATASKVSPFESSVNSGGASTNLVEISENLDQLLAQIELDERLKIGQENIANRLWEVSESYDQSKVPEAVSWTCDDPTLGLLRLAAQCSEAVYNRTQTAQTGLELGPQDTFENIKSIPASGDGSIKATLIRSYLDTRTIVISFRGTKATSPIDWLTNVNGDAVDAREFLHGVPDAKAHSGFLYVARNMASTVYETISSWTDQADQFLLTGHSAGGAVAALLFAHFKLSGVLPSATLHCITFGAPPVMSPRMTSTAVQSSNASFLSIVNNGDPVVRADKPYIRTLLEVYVKPNPEERLDFAASELFNCGSVILLHDRNVESEDADIDAVEATDSIGSVLFGNVKAHSMKQYLTMLQLWTRSRA